METNIVSSPKKYSIWKTPFLCLFSGNLYRDIGKNWKGVGFGYLFLILALGWIPAAVRIHVEVSKFIHEHSGEVFKDMPDFKIQNGKFSINVKQPYFMPDRKAPSMIIDTTGQITSISQVPTAENVESVILITETEMITHRKALGLNQDQVVQFSQFGPMNVDKKTLTGLVDTLGRLSGYIIYPFAVIGHFIYNMIAVLVYALVGLIVASIMKAPLKYEALMRLAAVSHTPALLLALIFFLTDVTVPFAFLAYFLFSTAYLSAAIWANKNNPPPVPGVIVS